ncbi:MAG TPA: hypothetical protein VFQ42_04020 [Mycobacterium sp.]|nr:hypothetical protein [Mycobacterium sp.]
MTKQSGLGMAFYIDGYDLSGDTQQLSSVAAPMKPIDVTGIDKSAVERIPGLRDGLIDWVSFFDVATGTAHPVLSQLPTADAGVMAVINKAIGGPAACMIGKQINYDPTRGTDGSLTFKVNAQANAYGLEWANMLTAGTRTDTAATNGAAWDRGAGFATPSVPASTVPVTNTSSVPATVVISGGTMTNVSVNGVTVGTGAGTYTVPAGGTITMTYTVAPTWTWALQSSWGAQLYLQALAFTGTDATVTVQDSADNSTWANVSGASFTAITSSNQFQRIGLSNTATIRRYLRAITTTSGGFTSLAFAVAINVNTVAGVVF